MSFESFGLHESLLKVFAEIGFEKPTPIQQQAIPLVMSGKDLLGSAQTGTGKTAAFLLPVIHRLLTEPAEGTQVLVLEPTRELALQVEEQAKLFSRYTSLRSACVHGGVAFGPQEKAFQDGVEIIAATPGRLLDHLRQGNARFNKLRVLVLDEVDRMLDMGFLPDVRSILRQLPESRQTLFFSATVPSEIGRLADGMLKDPAKVAITPERKTAEGVTQQVYLVPDHLKAKLLELLLSHEHVTSALVFTRTKQGADKVCAVVERQGLPVSRIHGDLSQSQRLKALAQFKEGEVKFLVATDIAARGLDVDGISHVINYDVPESPDDYTHRVGRTARAGETGHAYTLCGPREAGLVSGIEKYLGHKIEKVTMPEFDYTETLGVQHEVRQGHNVRDYDDLGSPGAQPVPSAAAAPGAPYTPGSPRGFKDSDERASILVLYSPTATEADADTVESLRESGRGGDDDGGRGRGGRDRGRGGRDRGGRGGRDGGRDRGGRDGGRSGEERRSSGHGAHGGDEAPKAERFPRGDRHQANAALSATDVLRNASDQKAVVSSDMMDLRPPHETEGDDEGEESFQDAPAGQEQAPRMGQPQGQPRADGDPAKRKRRRRRRGKGPGEFAQAQAQGQHSGQAQGRPQPSGRPQGGGREGWRNDRDGRGRDGRPPRDGQRWQGQRDERPSAKPSLWQRLKNTLGLGGGGSGSRGDKW